MAPRNEKHRQSRTMSGTDETTERPDIGTRRRSVGGERPETVPQSDACSRAEKKRMTDRIAQQKHRRRQREYIAHLEQQLQAIQEGGQSELARVVNENSRLRQEIKTLHGLFDQLQRVLQVRAEMLSHPSYDESTTPQNQHRPLDSIANSGNGTEDEATALLEVKDTCIDDLVMQVEPAQNFNDGSPQVLHQQAWQQPELDIDVTDAPTNLIVPTTISDPPAQTTFADPVECSKAVSSHDHSWSPDFGRAHVLDSVTSWWLDPTQTNSSHTQNDTQTITVSINANDSAPVPNNDCDQTNLEARYEDQPSPTKLLDCLPLSECPDASYEDMLPQTITFRLSPSLFTSIRSCSRLPSFISPPPPQDVEMHRILQVAQSELHNIGPPKFLDFVLDDTENKLALAVKSFTAPMKAMKKSSEFLAAYWILYLLFRWQAALDEQSYLALPDWLRPTPLQLELEHHAVLDQVPWPALRDELIQLSVTDMNQTYEVLKDIGNYLVVDLGTTQPSPKVELGMDVAQVCRNILDLSRWKLKQGFFEKYHQWWWLDAR